MYELKRETFLPRPLSKVFPFFADAGNLEALTPANLQFRILTEGPLDMRAGLLIDYRIRIFRVPFRWQTLIEVWEPEKRFVDVQLKGPYKSWRHTHSFEETAQGTWVRDSVEYEMPFGPLGRFTHALMVRRMLKNIFDFREQKMRELL